MENTPHQTIPDWCPILEVNKALQSLQVDMAVVRTHVTEIKADVAEVKAHQVKQNGAVVSLQSDALKAEGGVAMLKWMIGVLLALMALGVSFAGMMLARGG